MRAPASITNSCDSSSLTTAAVKPAALDALPDVYTALGLNSSTCLETMNVKFYLRMLDLKSYHRAIIITSYRITADHKTTLCPAHSMGHVRSISKKLIILLLVDMKQDIEKAH